MMDEALEGPDAARARLRALVASIDQELLRLPRRTTGDNETGGLFDSWSALVKQLALGPAPDLRRCPVCNNLGMRAASLCGHCWSKLSPAQASASLYP